jgi:hypothetical protein
MGPTGGLEPGCIHRHAGLIVEEVALSFPPALMGQGSLAFDQHAPVRTKSIDKSKRIVLVLVSVSGLDLHPTENRSAKRE